MARSVGVGGELAVQLAAEPRQLFRRKGEEDFQQVVEFDVRRGDEHKVLTKKILRQLNGQVDWKILTPRG